MKYYKRDYEEGTWYWKLDGGKWYVWDELLGMKKWWPINKGIRLNSNIGSISIATFIMPKDIDELEEISEPEVFIGLL